MNLILWSLLACGGVEAPSYTGTISVTEIEVASALAGRLAEVRFAEGDRVEPGDVVFTLDAAQMSADRAAMQAAADAAEAGVDAARAQVAAADAQVAWLAREVQRVRGMEADGVGTSRQRSELEGQLAIARAHADAARQQEALARAGQAQAEAALRAVDERLAEAAVEAAVGGVVLSRNREPGEVVGPGASVLTLGDLHRPRLRIYVPLGVVGALEIGEPVQVRIDARDAPLVGHVARVAQEAEFTPREILTPDERAKRVFAVDVALEPGPGVLPGVPAEAVFGS